MRNLLISYDVLFGVLTIAGGMIGFARAKSRASLIAGGLFGFLLLAAAYLLAWGPLDGRPLGLIVSILLAGRFMPAFARTKAWMPAGMMSVLSGIGVLLGIASFFR